MNSMLQDVRYSSRQLARSPGFTLTAVISLGLGIGATTAVFSVIYAALIHPYPFRAADGILRLTISNTANSVEELRLSVPQLQQLKQLSIIESVLAMDYHAMTVTGQELPENVNVVGLISTGFNDLGVPPVMGRGLIPSDAIDGKEPAAVAVVSYRFWQQHMGSDPDALGKTLQMDHKTFTVVGVAAPRFRWYNADVYLPLNMVSDPNHYCVIDFRLRPGVSLQAANAALQPLMEQFAKDAPKRFPEHFKMQVEDLNAWVSRGMSGTLYLLFGAVALLLTIGCGNVSILLMAQGTARQHEFAVRSAVGAGSGRIVRQLLTESILLAALGVIFGVLASYGILAGIKAVLPKYAFAPEVVIGINIPVLLFSVAVALTAALVSGLWPALQLSRTQLNQVIVSNNRRTAGSVRGRRTHDALIALQVALTLALLAGAGSAMKGFLRLIHTPLGYDPHHVMSVGIPLRENSYTSFASRTAYFEQLRQKVAETPGVTMAAISTNAVPPRNGWYQKFEILGKPSASAEQQSAGVNLVSPDYFATLRVPLLEGRIWDDKENHNSSQVSVINKTLARQYFANQSAIGQSIQLPGLNEDSPGSVSANQIGSAWLQVIGVVADARNNGLSRPIRPAIFVPFPLHMWSGTQILVRTDTSPLTLVRAIRKQLVAVNAGQQTTNVTGDLETWLTEEQEWQQERLAAWVFGVFSGLALALAAVGLFSVVSTVAQRTNEFGIRMALGAERAHITRIVLGSMVWSVGGGIGAGLVLSVALSGVVARWANSDSRDPAVLAAGVLLVIAAAGIASTIPAWRASQVDPVTALRAE